MDDASFLRELFKKLDDQKRTLALTEGLIKSVGKRYSRSKGYQMTLDFPQLRSLLERESNAKLR